MRKENLLKSRYIIYLVLLLFFVACSKDNELFSESSPVVVTHDGKLSGRLKHGKEIEAEDGDRNSWFVGEAVVNEVDKIDITLRKSPTNQFHLGCSGVNNGVFSLNLKNPPEEYFRSIDEFIYIDKEGLTISERNANMFDYLYPELYKDGSPIGTIRLASGVNKSVYYNIIYVDRDVSITGTYVYLHYFNVEYNVYFKKGWNVVATSHNFDEESTTKTYMFNTINDYQELDWVYLLK